MNVREKGMFAGVEINGNLRLYRRVYTARTRMRFAVVRFPCD